jgi:hypothetical protein
MSRQGIPNRAGQIWYYNDNSLNPNDYFFFLVVETHLNFHDILCLCQSHENSRNRAGTITSTSESSKSWEISSYMKRLI